MELSDCKILAGLPADVLARLENAAHWRRCPRGEYIISHREKSTFLCFLVEGDARILIDTEGGHEVFLAELHPGDHFGELSMLDGLERSASVVATRNCRLAMLDRDIVWATMRETPQFAITMLEHLARLLRRDKHRVVDLSTETATQRVFDQLLQLAEPSPDGNEHWHIPRLPSHKELSVRAGTSSEVVARAIGQLLELGIIKRNNLRLTITDRDRVAELALSHTTAEPSPASWP